MPGRRVLTDEQFEGLLALPTAEPELVRHYTLERADLTRSSVAGATTIG